MINVCVFLGYTVATNIDGWNQKYKEGIINDSMPYGYDNASSEEINVDYIRLNKFEKKILFNRYFQYGYLYLIKLPILLFKYDVVWTHYDKDSLYIAKLRRIPTINKFMAKQVANFVWLIDKSKGYSAKKNKRISKVLSRIDKIIYLASTETQKFIDIFNVNPARLQFVHFGINFDAYSSNEPSTKPKDIDGNEENFILSVGTDMHRDIDLLDDLASLMKDKNFILCSRNEEYLNKRYKSSNLKVVCANLSEMRYLYNNCSCVIIPLKYNEHASGCTTLIEAAAMKKPFIISDIPGIRDYVTENETGIITPIGDAEKFKEAVLKVTSDEQYAKTLVENAYNYMKDRFTTKKWAQEHVKITKEILGRNK